jgi:hypothetical protein
LELASIRDRAKQKFEDVRVVETAIKLAGSIGGFAAEDELEDEDYIDGLSEIILSVAPHQTLMEAFREFSSQVTTNGATLESLVELFSTTRVAELASYGQIALERVTALENLERVIDAKANELDLQKIICSAPWMIDPTWTVVTANEQLRTFANRMCAYWKDYYGECLVIAVDHETSKPDFTALGVRGQLHAVEIKRPGHNFDNEDYERFEKYIHAFRNLFRDHGTIRTDFPNGWRILLVCDGMNLSNTTQHEAMSSFINKNEVERISWTDFLTGAQRANNSFLEARREARKTTSAIE